jgi:hypothetical protein
MFRCEAVAEGHLAVSLSRRHRRLVAEMSSLRDILTKFDSPKKTGGQYLVRCPVHEDRRASLAIREGEDGRVLVHCHAGCSTGTILNALGLEEHDLFPPSEGARREIVAAYDYIDEKSDRLYQVVKYSPKDFVQRRPDGAGGWIYSLGETRRVLYRLHDIQKKPGVLIVEGEKDADRAWTVGVPATTNVGGAGKWRADYTKQLMAAGVRRAVIVPDNDVPGRKHASDVAASLVEGGLAVRICILPDVPPKGDLSDYLSTHSKDDFLALLKQAPVWTPASDLIATTAPQPLTPITTFSCADGKYVWSLLPPGVMFELDRVRREHHELCGELTVRTDISGTAKTKGGALMTAEFNLSSARARQERAKLLAQRARTGDSIDWFGLLEEFCERVFEAERSGTPAIRLDEGEPSQTNNAGISIDGVTLLLNYPVILFGDGGTAKSYLGLYFAGRMSQEGHKVLYADWELLPDEHRVRMHRLFGAERPPLWYLACERPLVAERERIAKTIQTNGIGYLIVDSVAVACDGPPEAAEVTTAYFRALRALGIGSLNVAHTNRSDQADKKPFGSTFWHNLARATWFCQRGEDNDDPRILTIGLFNRKANLGPLQPAVGFRFQFEADRTLLVTHDVRKCPEFAGHLAMWQRIQAVLANGPMTTAAIASEINAKENSIRQAVIRRPHLFARVHDAPDGVQRVKLHNAGRDTSRVSRDTSHDSDE